MIDKNLKKHFNDLVYSLNVKYNLFLNNHQYRSKHFQKDEDYSKIQNKLAEEIQTCNNDMKELLQKFINQSFDNIEVIAYDSRTLCVVEDKEKIGNILVKNVDDEFIQKIKDEIKNNFEFDIGIDKFEDLPEDVKNKFTF